jgi:hypothetical protein
VILRTKGKIGYEQEGAVCGVAPALGMLAHGPAAAVTHTPAKTAKTVPTHHLQRVDGSRCKVSMSHAEITSGMTLEFRSKANGDRNCIGTIKAAGLYGSSHIKVWVARPGRNYCEKEEVKSVVEACNMSFTHPFTIFARGNNGGHASWPV